MVANPSAVAMINKVMQPLRARVQNGRLILEDPSTELPEGAEVHLAIVDDADELDERERAKLDAALRRSLAQAKAGQFVDADDVIEALLARG
jgi:hypothetical protein